MRTGTRGMASRIAAAVAAAVALLAIGASGCELAVPDTVPAFSCEQGAANCPAGSMCAPAGMCVSLDTICTNVSCGVGQVCNPGTLQCDSMDSGTSSPGASGDGGGTSSSYADGGTPCPSGALALLCTCSGPGNCPGGFCADEATVTPDVYLQAAMWHFCSKPCCTSADCDDSTVCFATGAHGSFCVAPTWLGRTALTAGTGLGGAACGADTDCRSRLCVTGFCADTCCSTAQAASECASGSSCVFGPFPGKSFDVHQAAHCAGQDTGLSVDGSRCGRDSDCSSGFCQGQGNRSGGGGGGAQNNGTCRGPCRSSAECGPGSGCNYVTDSSDAVATCVSGPGMGAEGSACQNGGDCASGLCDTVNLKCTDVCFSDGDCTVTGWHCLPEITTSGTATTSLLRCGP